MQSIGFLGVRQCEILEFVALPTIMHPSNELQKGNKFGQEVPVKVQVGSYLLACCKPLAQHKQNEGCAVIVHGIY